MEKLLKVTFVPLLVLPALLYSAYGAEISGYTSTYYACVGLAIACPNIPEGSCCNFQGLPISFVRWYGIGHTNLAVQYNGGGCNTAFGYGCGQNNRCLRGSGATGAKWVQGCSSSSIASIYNSTSPTCNSTMIPTSVKFIDTTAKRLYVLSCNSTDVLKIFTEIDQLNTDIEKINALVSRGASNSTELEIMV